MSFDHLQMNWLRTFEAAGRYQSFTEAAQHKNMTPSAVSQQIRLLEHQLGHQLFIRLPRGIRLSDFGRAYLPVVQEAFKQLDRGTSQIFSPVNAGSLELSVNHSFACLWLSTELREFRELYPQVRIGIIGNNWASDFETSTTGLEIRYGSGEWPGYKSHRLFAPRLRPYCSPQMATELKNPEDLLQQPLIEVMGTQVGWDDWFEAQGLRGIKPPVLHRVDSASYSVPMAANNFGVCLIYEEYCTCGALAQALTSPFSEFVETPSNYYLSYRQENQLSPTEIIFVQWLLESLPGSDS